MKRYIESSLVFILIFVFNIVAKEKKYEPNWKSLDQHPTPEWFLDAKFGVFVYWGVSSVPGWAPVGQYSEWYWKRVGNIALEEPWNKPNNPWWQFHSKTYGRDFTYYEFAPRFTAELFDPYKWAEIIANSGARYVVHNTKHHDGYCMWPYRPASKAYGIPWNSMEVGPRRDLVGELAKALRDSTNVRAGVYYSLYEWYHPLWLRDREKYAIEYMHPQFKDMVRRYAPDIIFSDGEWDMEWEKWQSPKLLAWLYNESPCKDYVVVNDRWGKNTRHEHGDYFTTEYGAGMPNATHPWEESRGIGYSYAVNRAEQLDDYKTSRELVLMLIDLVSRGGNFLLDIGPFADGTIPVVMQDRLADIGAWLKVNGEAIYGTRPFEKSCQWSDGTVPSLEYKHYRSEYDILDLAGDTAKPGMAFKEVLFTRNKNNIYAILPLWPLKPVVLENFKAKTNTRISLLGYDKPLKYKQDGSDLLIYMPDLQPGEEPCRFAYSLKLENIDF